MSAAPKTGDNMIDLLRRRLEIYQARPKAETVIEQEALAAETADLARRTAARAAELFRWRLDAPASDPTPGWSDACDRRHKEIELYVLWQCVGFAAVAR